MRSVRHRRKCAEVVDPVQVRRGEGDVKAAEEEVDRVRVLGAERGGQRAADPGGSGRRAELGVRPVGWIEGRGKGRRRRGTAEGGGREVSELEGKGRWELNELDW